MKSSELKSFQELSYFDNEALFYLFRETPPQTLALAFLKGDNKVSGSILGIMDPKRRKYIHSLMSKNRNSDERDIESAISGMLLIADGLIQKGLIIKKGMYYYGVSKENPDQAHGEL
ncbi:MAG: hypothetical protein H7A24_02505 [Leptospiraceae bacterium]|nr:hypothetical protein [Leptospiraceae bacterium]MCP5510722.1 hypothetical protein [Leptospiraceae bacterium]